MIKYFYCSFFAALISSNLLGQNIVMNEVYSAVLCEDGTVYSSGLDADIQNIINTSSLIFRKVNTIDSVKTISGGIGNGNVLFLRKNGTVVGTGNNTSGALGTGYPINKLVFYKAVVDLTDVVHISTSGVHSLFVKADGTVWAAGNNSQGQLGFGNTYFEPVTPYQIPDLTDVKCVATGGFVSFFIKNDGTLFACGDNSDGQLGIGNSTDQSFPQKVSTLSNLRKVVTSGHSSFFLLDDGTVYTSGVNYDGHMAIGSYSMVMTPKKIMGLGAVKDISVSQDFNYLHTLFLLEDGTVAACGNNFGGQLGDGTLINKNTPIVIPGISDAINIHAGVGSSLIGKLDGTFSVIGLNINGQLGSNVSEKRTALTNYPAPCNLLITSASEIDENNNLLLYPNPSNGILKLGGTVFETSDLIQVKVFDLSGSLVYSEFVSSDEKSIDLSNFPSGIYFIQLSNTFKIIASGKMILEQ